MSRAGDFAIRMAEARNHERTRPTGEFQSADYRINVEVSDMGWLRLKVTQIVGVGGDTYKTVEVSSTQAVKLGRWLLETFAEPDA